VVQASLSKVKMIVAVRPPAFGTSPVPIAIFTASSKASWLRCAAVR